MMVDINQNISIIILNVSKVNVLIKIQKLSNWVKKQNSIACYLQEAHQDIRIWKS